MEGRYADSLCVPEMFQKRQTLSFLGRRSFAPRPLSDATEIYDTDIEDDEDSPASLDSSSTISDVNELLTPPGSADLSLANFEFVLDTESVSGPYGPHMFDRKPSQPTQIATCLSPVPETPVTPVAPPKNITLLNKAVAELDETTVRNWTPEDVADWMIMAGFDSAVVDKFLVHDICGTVLLDLQFEDLKELDISSFGKRHQVMTSIQNLRNSTLITTSTAPVVRRLSSVTRTESHRRGRHQRLSSEDVTPAESVSIVAIEQLLPKPHKCSKGENCAKWQKQQRKIQKLEEEFDADVQSIVAPSVVAASDIFGAVPGLNITSERLSTVEPRDPLESVRNFLNFQHVNSPTAATFPSIDQATSAPPVPIIPAHFVQNLGGLPKLTIPTEHRSSESPYHTPISALRHPTEIQAKLRAELQQDPYHYGGVASPVDVYQMNTPMSLSDLPITAIPIDPCHREASQSVPPEMRYGNTTTVTRDPIQRSLSVQPGGRRPRRLSFAPQMSAVREDLASPGLLPPVVANEANLAVHGGWMCKRRPSRVVGHEWHSNYFTLSGTQLGIAKDEHSGNFESINVDEYTLHTYTTASSSKFSAAFKKGLGNSGEPSFAFSLIPEASKNKKLFEKEKSHHFAVNSGADRVEWMRKLMLAKAMKKNDGQI